MKDRDNQHSSPIDSRKEYWINKRGYENWLITPEGLGNHAVRQFVGLTIDTERLWGSIYTEMHMHPNATLLEFNSFHKLLEEGNLEAPSKEFGPTIAMRLVQSEKLADAMQSVLGEGGLKYNGRMNKMVSFSIEGAIAPLGLDVVTEPAITTTDHSGVSNLRSGIWQTDDTNDADKREFLPDDGTIFGHHTESEEFIPPHLRTSPDDTRHFYRIAQELGIPHESWNNERVIGFVQVVREVDDLLGAMTVASLQPGAPGLIPEDSERIYTAGKIMQVMSALLKTGFKGQQLDNNFVVDTLNEGLTKNYGITVRRQPQQENLLPGQP